MQIEQNASLVEHSTMRLGGTVDFLITISSKQELLEALEFIDKKNLPYRMIGNGSNIVWSGDFSGVILVNAIKGISFNGSTVTVGAGELWDNVVQATVNEGLSGLECLSLIPGTTGATPVQNVGAYGTEVKDTIAHVRAYDTKLKEFVVLQNTECNFGYRVSRFNTTDIGRFLITQVVFTLSTALPTPPFYAALQQYLDEHALFEYTAQVLRDAVIAIRQSKLPDPALVPNCGSFFKNPIIEKKHFDALKVTYPAIPGWPQDGKVKVPAAWLLETLGFKNYTDEITGMGTFEKHPLVVINKHAKTANDLLKFKQSLVSAVQKEFGIALVQEPELV